VRFDVINRRSHKWSALQTGLELNRNSKKLRVGGPNEEGSARCRCVRALSMGLFGKSLRGKKNMRSLTAYFVLLVVFMASGSLAHSQIAHSQGTEPASNSGGSTSESATKAEVSELRSEVAAQRKTIEELKALVEKLVDGKASAAALQTGGLQSGALQTGKESSVQIRPVADSASMDANAPAVDAPGTGSVHLMNAVLVQPDPVVEAALLEQAPSANAMKKDTPLTAGWNGEHFFIRSADGQFSISPYGYVNTDYRAYSGDGSPANTFVLRQARFGFQGSYGSHFDFAILADAAATSGSVVRDVYLNVRLKPEFQFQAGQFKAPFGQETGIGDTSLDFVERGFQSLLYPSAATAYRSPGAAFHGDIDGGVVQYWVGAFNGKGYALVNTTNQPEVVGRLRFYPWRKTTNHWLKEFAFGGSLDFARSRGLSGDQSFNGTLPDAAYNFFPQFPINGDIQRYNGEFTYLQGPFSLRGEFDQLNMDRTNVGSLQQNWLGFMSLPTIRAKAWDVSTTYLLTGEKRPENGTPRVKRPLFGPDTPGGQGRGWGAWEAAFRFTGIQANEPGASFVNNITDGFVPTFFNHTNEYTIGVNWYPNYWVKYVLNVGIDQLKEPSVIGQEPGNFYVVTQRVQFRF
jgi:phosphate-selective porin